METKINVMLDSSIIEKNTKEAVQVEVIEVTQVERTEFETSEGTVKFDKPTTVSVEKSRLLNLGVINTRLQKIDGEVRSLGEEKESLLAEKTLIEPAIDAKIDDAVAEGAHDRRSEPLPEETPAQ